MPTGLSERQCIVKFEQIVNVCGEWYRMIHGKCVDVMLGAEWGLMPIALVVGTDRRGEFTMGLGLAVRICCID